MLKEKLTNQKGITLIALIITIIVMLILVGVSVTVALNGGLFSTAESAKVKTEAELEKENTLDSGKIEVDGKLYNSYEDYIAGNEAIILPEGWEKATKPAEWDSEKVTAITDGTNTIPLPEGYSVSDIEGETTVAEGLVITDGENEFVWIPVSTDFSSSYDTGYNYSEPRALTDNYSPASSVLDSQETLNYLYKYKENEEPFYNYSVDFAYNTHYEEMVASVNKYGGFYIGRYETTIDVNNNIGSKYNTPVLTADKKIPQTNNKNVRWWGLYYAQRNSNVVGNGNNVQTNMIWGQQWDAMLNFLGTEQASSSISGSQSQVLKSGEATYDNDLKDEMNNIYDLRNNGYEWIAESYYIIDRVYRGGYYRLSISASSGAHYGPTSPSAYYASRLTLYIK